MNEPAEIRLRGDAIQVINGKIGVKGTSEEKVSESEVQKEGTILRYVTLKVKNNSLSRKHFVIKGPNERGREFSYGFPMMPMATRSKKVPIGTMIFLQNNEISNKKLITITAADDGKVVNLFAK